MRYIPKPIAVRSENLVTSIKASKRSSIVPLPQKILRTVSEFGQGPRKFLEFGRPGSVSVWWCPFGARDYPCICLCIWLRRYRCVCAWLVFIWRQRLSMHVTHVCLYSKIFKLHFDFHILIKMINAHQKA